jgi:hypothetical protein
MSASAAAGLTEVFEFVAAAFPAFAGLLAALFAPPCSPQESANDDAIQSAAIAITFLLITFSLKC